MNPTEAVALAGYTRAHFPSQPIDEYTADALAELLAPYSLADCQAAVLALAMRTHDHAERTKWCSPTDIYAEVRRARADRLESAVYDPPPNADPDDVQGYLRWLRNEREAIASGRETTEQAAAAVAARDVVKELGYVGQSVEAASDARAGIEAARLKKQAAEADKKRRRDERQAELARMRDADRAARATDTTQPTPATTDERPADE